MFATRAFVAFVTTSTDGVKVEDEALDDVAMSAVAIVGGATFPLAGAKRTMRTDAPVPFAFGSQVNGDANDAASATLHAMNKRKGEPPDTPTLATDVHPVGVDGAF